MLIGNAPNNYLPLVSERLIRLLDWCLLLRFRQAAQAAMDLSANCWNLEAKTTTSSPSSTLTSECREKGTAAFRGLLSSPAPTQRNGRTQLSCAISAEWASGTADETQHAQQTPMMLSAAACNASQASSGSPCGEPGRSSCASRSSTEGGGPDEYVKALQEAGKYALWAPLLRDTFLLEEPSLLLGQICFDVTADDQRGSWLLPEELLSHQSEPADEDGNDRQLFTNTPITEDEQQAIDEVLLQLLGLQKQEDAANATQQWPEALLGVQPVWLEHLVLRYLYSCSFDKQKTFDLLQSTLAFRTQQLPVLESEVYHELRNMGACYWHGRDRRMRPLLVISLQRLQQLQREAAVEEKVTRLVIFCLEFFLRYLCVAGVVESWCILCDLNGTSISSFPLPLLLRLVQLIQGSYRGRLYRFYILYAPRLFHFIAKPLVSSLPTTTAKKIRVFTNPDDWDQERRTQFAAHQLEKKYGGTAPDISEHWYPFRFFPGPFEPECGAGQNGAPKTVVRWESEQALHVRVHPLVHTGVSLHTSLVWKRGAEEQSPPFRYAAWLRHLPELYLAPSTVGWAKSMLSSCLQGHHDFLILHLRNSQAGTAGSSLNLAVDKGTAEGTPRSSSVDKAKEEFRIQREAQLLPEHSLFSAAVADAPKVPTTWTVRFSSRQESSAGSVSLLHPLRICLPTPVAGSQTTAWCAAATTAKDLTAAATTSALPTPAEREGLKESNSPAEPSSVCSSRASTSAERFQLPLPHAAPGETSASAVAEGQCDGWSSLFATAGEYNHARQSQSVPPSGATTCVTTSDACTTLAPEAQTQAFRYDCVESQASKLDILEGSCESIVLMRMCGPPPAKVQPRRCSPLSTAACNEARGPQTSKQNNADMLGTTLTSLQNKRHIRRGWRLESDSRTNSEGSTRLPSAINRNPLCLRRLEGPIQQQQSRRARSSTSFSAGNAFLSALQTGEGTGIRRCSTLGKRLADFSKVYFLGSQMSSQSSTPTVASMRAVSGSSGDRTEQPSLSMEGRQLFKVAQRKTRVLAAHAGCQFGRGRRIQLREPKLTAQAPTLQSRHQVEHHTQQLKFSGFLAQRRTSLSPSSRAHNEPRSFRGHATSIHAASPALRRAVSLHSRHQAVLSREAKIERSCVAPVDTEAKCRGFSQMNKKVQNWAKEEKVSQMQDATVPVITASSIAEQVRDEGMPRKSGVAQSRGGMSWSSSGKPRRSVGKFLPLFLLAASAMNLAVCAGSPISAEDAGFAVVLPQRWATPQPSRLSQFHRLGWTDRFIVSAIEGSRGMVDSTLQRSEWRKWNAVASSASHRGLRPTGAQDYRHCWKVPQQQVAWLQPLYCRASQTIKASCLFGKGRRAQPFNSGASGLLCSTSCSKHPIHGLQPGPNLPTVPYGLYMRRAVRVAAVKQKSRGSIDKRFKVTATGKLLYKRPGQQHHAHTKSSARRTRLRRVATLKSSQISRLLGPLRLRG